MKKVLTFSVLVTICLTVSALHSYAITTYEVECAECETTYSECNGGVLIGDNARPIGCSRNWITWPPWPPGHYCDGSCYRCTANASDDFCKFRRGHTCLVPTFGTWVVTCGNRMKYDCGGVWSNLCSCPSTGGTMTTTSCDPNFCLG